jgi:integrase
MDHIEDYMTQKYGKPYESTYEGLLGVSWEERLTHPRLDEFYSPVEREALRLMNEAPKDRRVLLSEALERYLSEHKNGQDIRFARDTRRAIGIVISTVGDLPLSEYSRDHARAIRDALLPGHSSATVRRRLDSISAVFNLGRREFSLKGCENPFEKMQIPREGLDAKKRVPFTTDELQLISDACLKENDDIRWIIATQISTGARLGEIVGLRVVNSLSIATPFRVRFRPLLNE